MAETELAPEWPRLRRSLQNADGFALYFVFTDWPEQVAAGKACLKQSLRFSTRRLREVRPANPDALVPEALDALLGEAGGGQPVWLDCWRYAEDESWNRERSRLLARLNEGRGRLEKDFAAPLILLLPRAQVSQTAETAPDLWSVRRLTLHLARPAPTAGQLPTFMPPGPRSEPPSPGALEKAERHLAAWRAQTDPETRSLPDAWAAVESLREVGKLGEARIVAAEALALARAQRDDTKAESLYDLSRSLSTIGDVAWDSDQWQEAESVWQEGLEVARHYAGIQGETGLSLLLMAVVLDRMGNAAWKLGQREEGECAWREGLGIIQRLLQSVDESPGVLDVLSIALQKVAFAAFSFGRPEEGERGWRESLRIRHRLLSTLGETPQRIGDLIFTVDALSMVLEDQGRGDEAEALRAERAALAERLEAMNTSGLG